MKENLKLEFVCIKSLFYAVRSFQNKRLRETELFSLKQAISFMWFPQYHVVSLNVLFHLTEPELT